MSRSRNRARRRWQTNRPAPTRDTDTGPCPDCGQPRRVITTVWSFDCFAGEHEGPPPGSVQGERERLHTELSDIVRERREMAETAEHLRAQVEQQLRRLEALASELAPPPEEPGDAGAEPAP